MRRQDRRLGLTIALILSTGAVMTMADQPRGYSIPLIDLDGEKHRQVVVDREEGQYLGHPTTVLLEDNRTMICVYPKGHGGGAIVMKRSTDAGLTWSERLPTPENWATSREVPTIYRVVDPEGVRRLIMFSGLYPIRMAVSEDDGETWTPLAPIGDYGGVVAMADCMRLKDGRYMAVFHDDGRFIDNAGERQHPAIVYRVLSEDGGLTWGEPEPLVTHSEANLCEPGLVRSPDGDTIAMLLRENSRQFNSFVSFSTDEGQTWSEPVELPGALTGDRHQAVYAPDGRLFISFRDTTHESPTKGDWVGWVGTWDDIVNLNEGQYRVRLADNTKGADCAYPALEMLPDGTIVATTYGHWIEGEEPFILSVRFTLEELDAKAAAMEGEQ
ncbi:MAG: sialidase family protein [Armatimonadota bacterium]